MDRPAKRTRVAVALAAGLTALALAGGCAADETGVPGLAYRDLEFIEAGGVEPRPQASWFEPGDDLSGSDYRAAFTGDRIRDLTLEEDPERGWAGILLQLDDRGVEKLEELTASTVGEQVLVVLDGKVISAPIVREPVAEGVLYISGRPDEMRDLFARLNEPSATP